jgi:hypothetical protein
MPSYLSHTQQFTDVSGNFCGGKTVYFNIYAMVRGQGCWKLGHSRSPDFNLCYYYDYYLYETMKYSM